MKALIFDMDGTLVDNMKFHIQAWSQMFAEIGLEVDSRSICNKAAGATNEDLLRNKIGLQLSDEEVRRYSRHKEELYREIYASHLKPLPGLLELLAQAQELDIPIALGTAACPENVAFTLDGLNIRPYFDVIVCEKDVKRGKPDPALFLTAAQRLEVKPSSCIVFEDALAGVEAARRANMAAIVLTTTLQAHEVHALTNVFMAVPDYRGLDLRELMEMTETASMASGVTC